MPMSSKLTHIKPVSAFERLPRLPRNSDDSAAAVLDLSHVQEAGDAEIPARHFTEASGSSHADALA